MSVKEITGLLSILPEKDKPSQAIKEELQAGNTAFRSVLLRRTLAFWNNNNPGSNYTLSSYPFKNGGMLEDGDINVGHSGYALGNLSNYPSDPTGSAVQLLTLDYSKFRATGTVGTVPSANLSRVHSGLAAYDALSSNTESAWGGNGLVSASDIPVDYTQIGIVYAHPIFIASSSGQSAANTQLVTAVGTNFVTFTANGWWDQQYITPTHFGVLRIATGADAGFYFVHSVDFANNRLFLRNLDGSPFIGQAAATIAGTDLYIGPGRVTYFNEVSIIPFSTGTVVTGGRFKPNPLTIRSSFILKIKIEKTGSTEAASGTEQQGSYYIGLKPWTHGEFDHANMWEHAFYRQTPNGGCATLAHNFVTGVGAAVGGGVNAFILNEADQRCWGGYTDTSNNSAIMHWRWRTIESPREVANYVGNAAHASFLTPTPVLATGDRIRGATLGSDKRVYFAIGHPTLGNGGLVVIKPDLTTLQYTENSPAGTGDTIGGTAPNMTLTDAGAVFNAGQVGQSITIASATTGANNGTFLITGFTSPTVITYQNHAGVAEAFTGTWTVLGVPDSNVAAVVADKTRARVGTAGDSSTAGNVVTTTTGAFTAADIGRVIKLTGLTGTDNGVYKISAQGGTTATVTTLAGATVTFAGGSGGTFEIGDRIYMFYSDATTGGGKINYVESLAPGTFLTRTVSMTNGATCNIQSANGENQKASIDPANGNVYWLSNDTQQQINKYNVTTNAHSLIAISDSNLLSPAGGVLNNTASPATNPTTPAAFTAIHVNSKFDEIWVGSDTGGHFKIVKSTFSNLTIKRYYGDEETIVAAGNGNYWTGTPLTTGNGNGTTGLSVSGNNVTLNASGTPFVASDVGKYVIITGATANANNGVFNPATGAPFRITAFTSSSQIVFTNTSPGVTQANYAGTFYVVSSYKQRSAGTFSSGASSNFVRNYWERPDGKMECNLWPNNTLNADFAVYSRAEDTWTWRNEISITQSTINGGGNKVYDSIGWFWYLAPGAAGSGSKMWLGSAEVHYQWIGSAWVPKEAGYIGTPNKSISDTTNPNLAAKPIHSGLEDVLYGVKIGFNRQGGATPPNNEFLGRMGQTRTTTADGATVLASNVFNGSSFVAGDVGRVLRIETGSDAGVYKIATQTTGQLTLKNMDGSTFSALAGVGSLTYTIWDFGSVGSNAGPEEMTVMLADGVGKDNTQDITGFTYEGYHFKTVLHENDEGRKFMVENPLAAPGGLATKAYFETYPRVVASPGQMDAPTSNHLALPGAETTNARQAFDGIVGKILDGSGAKPSLNSSPANAAIWYGNLAGSSVLGYSLMADFGADVQIGYAILRARGVTDSLLLSTNTNNGLLANVYKANNAGGTPVASSVTRTSGSTNISITADTTTASLSSGDFLGATSLTPTTPAVGAIVSGQSTFADTTNAQFLSTHVGQILKITAGAGADIGSYRIIGFTSSSIVTVRNLDQTSKTWTVSSSTVTYVVTDGVREEDKLVIGTNRLLVERLLSTTSLQVRVGPFSTQTSQSWTCVKPTWDVVKRISYSSEAAPPEVKNNGTWLSHDGRENYDTADVKIYMDFTDLPAASRTGRWWKFAAIPRFNVNSIDTTHNLSGWEFYDNTGQRIGVSKYTQVDESRTNLDYFFNHINRFDVIQSANDAVTDLGAFNGNVDLDGANGDTLTLAGGTKSFLGFQIGPLLTDGGLPTGTNIINSASSSWPLSAMPGRLIRITTGTNTGNFYRVLARPLSTQITVTTPSGSSVSWAGTESGINFSVHEGINVGGAFPDKITFLSDGKELTLLTINDALTTLTVSETLQTPRTGATWEIRRPGYDTTSATTEATKTARIPRPQSTYPVQSGDMTHDSRGTYRFFSEDIGTGFQRANGVIAGGSGAFTGTGFTSSDVGRLLYIISGTATQVNNGIYEISVFTSATAITVKNHYTGAAVSLTVDAGPVTYQVLGDRRFRLTRFVVGLRA